MGRRFKLNKNRAIAIITTILILSGVASLLIVNKSSPNKETDQVNISEYVEITPKSQIRLDTPKKLDDYISSLDKESSVQGETPKNIDWTSSDVIAIEYSMYVGRTIEGTMIEKTNESSDVIIVNVKEAPSGCYYPQINKIKVLFITAPKNNISYKIFQKIIPNEAKCNLD